MRLYPSLHLLKNTIDIKKIKMRKQVIKINITYSLVPRIYSFSKFIKSKKECNCQSLRIVFPANLAFLSNSSSILNN